MKQIGLGFMQYIQDYNGRLPLTASTGPAPRPTPWPAYGWADALQPYLKYTEIYQCPSQGDWGQTDPTKTGYIDYFFNAHLARTHLNNLADPSKSILMPEGNDGVDVTDARYAKPRIPPTWFKDENSPLYRHLDTTNYLYCDGHVKASKPAEIQKKLQGKALLY